MEHIQNNYKYNKIKKIIDCFLYNFQITHNKP